jgi:ATP-dependent Clp protease ATP-binding subunit ClpA
LNGSDKYITETPFPEKALELMDVVAMEKFGSKSVVTLADVNKVLSEKTGVSVGSLSDSEKEKLANLEEELKLREPIDEYIGKIQEQIDALRLDGTDKVRSLKNHIAVVKESKNLSK